MALYLRKNGTLKKISGLTESHNALTTIYNPDSSGLESTNVQDAIDEVYGKAQHGLYELWVNENPTATFQAQTITLNNIDVTKFDAIELEVNVSPTFGSKMGGQIQRFPLSLFGSTAYAIQSTVVVVNSAGKMVNYRRISNITLNGTTLTIVFNDATKTTFNTYGQAGSESADNGTMIPERILGLRHND